MDVRRCDVVRCGQGLRSCEAQVCPYLEIRSTHLTSNHEPFRLSPSAPIAAPIVLPAAASLKLILTAQEGKSGKRPHQAFLTLHQESTGLEESFAFSVKDNGKAKVDIVSSPYHAWSPIPLTWISPVPKRHPPPTCPLLRTTPRDHNSRLLRLLSSPPKLSLPSHNTARRYSLFCHPRARTLLRQTGNLPHLQIRSQITSNCDFPLLHPCHRWNFAGASRNLGRVGRKH